MLSSHSNRSRLTNWWWTVDKTILICICALMLIGIFLTFSASPAVATRIGYGNYHFIKRHLFFAPIAFGVMIFISMQRLKIIRRMSLVGYLVAIFLVMLTFITGEANKGAARWISLCGFSLQPSEFVKPFFIVTAAWLFAGHRQHSEFPGHWISTLLFCLTAGLIVIQPDVGMTFVITLVWGFQFYLSGLPIILVAVLAVMGMGGLIAAYFLFPHFQVRFHQFFASNGELSFQVKKSLEAFQSGNLFGRGPGEGIVRSHIPDAHTDFIYAVAAEEYGVFLCLFIIILYAVIVVRSLVLSCKDNNLFIILSASGLAASFGLQSIINMASTLHLIPTKGMTLPFISYGGSSIIATALGMGMLIAITRKNVHAEDKDDV
ncbi:MAG: cell division protein FtsW [Alphaproteobacteria bacterium]|nr:cell division protein FtsW [Alphaproteobacteria bacterium]